MKVSIFGSEILTNRKRPDMIAGVKSQKSDVPARMIRRMGCADGVDETQSLGR